MRVPGNINAVMWWPSAPGVRQCLWQHQGGSQPQACSITTTGIISLPPAFTLKALDIPQHTITIAVFDALSHEQNI